ncbi:histidine phosphatase superfamily [Aspergillus varians]
MRGRIHLLRHAEGIHALHQVASIPDAPLSERGFDFAEDLGRRFVNEHSNSTSAIISSPLSRTIQTALTAFPRILDTTQFPENSGLGAGNGVVLTLDANLQEIENLPCNTGKPKDSLAARFPRQGAEIDKLHQDWHKLDRSLEGLKNRLGDNDVIVVTHQGILELLAPTTNFPAGAWRIFDLARSRNGQLVLQ